MDQDATGPVAQLESERLSSKEQVASSNLAGASSLPS